MSVCVETICKVAGSAKQSVVDWEVAAVEWEAAERDHDKDWELDQDINEQAQRGARDGSWLNKTGEVEVE